jgi:hypothetical protein
MLLKVVHRVAVTVSSGKLCGVVSRGDIFYHAINREMSAAQVASRQKMPASRRKTVTKRAVAAQT